MTTVQFPLKPGAPDVGFRFTIPNTRQLELEAGCGIDLLRLRGQSVHAICLMTCYGLKWQDKKMTVDKASEMVQAYLDDGGTMKDLSEALVKAMNESGVYGEPDKPAEGDEPADPTKATTTIN